MAYKPSGYKIKHLTGMRTNKLRPIKKKGGGGVKFIFRKKKYINKEGAGGKCINIILKKPTNFKSEINKDLIIEKNLTSTYI